MSEKFEKCPNCDAKLSGMFSSSIVEDYQIKGIHDDIKKIKDELKDPPNDLEEKEAYCTGCHDDVIKEIAGFLNALDEQRLVKESDPKCPSCGIVGMDCISEFPSNSKRGSGDPWFEIVACIKCGHVYGTLGGQ